MGCSGSSAAGKPAEAAGSSSSSSSSSSSKRLLDEYIVGQTLGEGAFGVVYACTSRATGEEVAVKMVDKVETPVEAIRTEAELQKSLNCPNIVKVHQIFYERCFVCIIMDKFSGGDLVEGLHIHLKEKGTILGETIVHISLQMAVAIQYLHSRSIVHRDVKGDNYLMSVKDLTDKKCVVALADFGTAVPVKQGERLKDEVGTHIFWSPEFCANNYSLKVDIWAMGVITYGLLDGRFPFRDANDIKKKEPKLPKRVPPDCEDYVKGMLCKSELKRLSADQVVNHRWIASGGSVGNSVADGEDSGGNGANMRIDGADDGVSQRRSELLERLNNEQQGKHVLAGKKKAAPSQHYWAKWFTIVDKHQAGAMLTFEWWEASKVQESAILKMEGKLLTQADSDQAGKSPELVGKLLKDHNIDISKFGIGQAKSLTQMAGEVGNGSARLMLDASEHKKLVRVVDVVLLRIYDSNKAKVLIETAEQFPDGRKRELARLPGTKKEPHESSKETAERILRDLMNMADVTISFNYEEPEVFEEESESPSYPGVKTVYRKEILEGYVLATDKDILARVGLPTGGEWTAVDPLNYTKSFCWMTEKQATSKKVKLRRVGSEEVSGLVAAPIGLKEEALKRYLELHNIDTSLYGQRGVRTLKEFSSELIKGESSVCEDADGNVTRVVDLILMMIVNPGTGDVLIQTLQTTGDGSKNVLNRLPGAKRRPDENQFLTARRLLRKQLKIDENSCVLDPNGVKYYEEVRSSQAFPGVQTVYRKRLIRADLVKNPSCENPSNDYVDHVSM